MPVGREGPAVFEPLPVLSQPLPRPCRARVVARANIASRSHGVIRKGARSARGIGRRSGLRGPWPSFVVFFLTRSRSTAVAAFSTPAKSSGDEFTCTARRSPRRLITPEAVESMPWDSKNRGYRRQECDSGHGGARVHFKSMRRSSWPGGALSGPLGGFVS